MQINILNKVVCLKLQENNYKNMADMQINIIEATDSLIKG
jgi:hypothetical protein